MSDDPMDAILEFVWDAALKSCATDEDQEAAKALAFDKAREMLDVDIRDEAAGARLFRQAHAGPMGRPEADAPFDRERSILRLSRSLGADFTADGASEPQEPTS